ncbi:YSIRK-type signal peptide-containing protein [Dolosigranulum pigrum]|uniref:YSIRK-type signal peptide-containing protein n=1 Tax=Dolosigranulum pigrum TaxID=29394 RepID=UPI001AD89F00|nr:YSIRK-type signal peptide-containing protein [Dolosigranulum pigrum]QTJ33021.1 YSIRK-type signal peptide-containing protein [Dolosigranulum pigrum]
MVGKNNKRVLREKQANKFKRYALKKLTVGLASVTIGTGLAFATSSTVSADELAVGERTAVVSDKTAEEKPQPDTPYLQEQEEAVTPTEEPQVTEDRISEEKAVKTSEETEEKATESEKVVEEKQADSHEQTEETSDIEETNTKEPQATTTQLAPVAESVAEPVREEQSTEVPTTTLSQIDQLPEEFLTYLRDHSDIVDFKNAATIETYANLLQQSYGVEAAKEERIRAIEAAVKEIETTKEQAKNEVVDQTERLIDADNNNNERHLQAFTEAIHNSTDVKQTVEVYLQEVGYDQEVIAHILDNVDMTKTNNPKDLLNNIIQTGLQYAKDHQKPHVLPVLRNADGNFSFYGSGVKINREVDGPYRSELTFGESTNLSKYDKHSAAALNETIYFNKNFNIELEMDHQNIHTQDGSLGMGFMFVKDIGRSDFASKGGLLQEVGIKNAVGLRIKKDENSTSNRGYIEFVKTGDDGRVQTIGNTRQYFDFNDRNKKQTIQLSYNFSNKMLTIRNKELNYHKQIRMDIYGLQLLDKGDRDNRRLTSSFKFAIQSTTPSGRTSSNGPSVSVKTIDYQSNRHSLRGEVYLDSNNNKQRDDHEKGLAGIAVHLRSDDSFGKIIQRTVTGADGGYVFNNVAEGDANVEFVIPSDMTGTNIGIHYGWQHTNEHGTRVIGQTFELWHDYTLNAGMRYLDTPTYTIGDKVWLDSNGNGIQDEESGVENVEVTLVDEFGDIKAKTKTDQNGNYRFTNINRGNYQLVFNVPKGYSVTKSYQGDSRVLDSNSHISYLRITPENPNFSNNNNYTDLTHDLGLIKDVEYERTVEETPFNTIYQFDGSLNPGEIKLTTEGRNGREEVLYKRLSPTTADANSISPNNFSNFRNKYWEEISRENIQEKRDAVVKYNFDAIVNAESEGDNYVFTTSTGRRITVPKTAPNQSFEIKDDGNLYVTINGQEQNLGKVKGEKGKDGLTPKIGPNGTWVINGEDTGKAARGEKGDSITVTGTDKDGAGNTVVSFSDGSTATIAKGDKGDDGHTPEIGPNGTWVINGEDTGKAARGEKGDSITVTGTDKDGAGNTVVSFSDGSTATIAKGDKGDDGHTPEIGPNGTWVINGEDTGKAARGEKGDSITVTGTDKDGAGNTVVSFSDGSTATIAKGDKGDDGHTPEIGPNGTWVINGEDTGKAARGEKGDSITVTGTDKDGAGNTVVSFSDGSTATIAKGDKGDDGHTPEIGPNGTWVINGEDTGKAARGEKGDSITVTGTDKDGAGNTVVSFSDGSTATIAKGEKGDKGDDGHTPEIGPNGTWVINGEDTGKAARGEKGDSITVTGTDKDGAGNTVVSFSDGSTATIAKGEKGDKGDDGHTPEIGPNGTWVINGEDTGKAARGEKGDSITVTGTDKDGAGNTVVSFSDGSTATIAKGDKGDDGHTPEIGPNGTWVINGEDTGKAARGEKGDSITVTGTDKDGAGNTVVSFSDGSTATIAKGEKGDKGDDGHTPEIGPNGTWVINGEDTGKAARGEKGDSITVTGTDKDGAGNTVVSFSDGSTATIAKGDKGDDGHTPEIGPNGTWVINGEDTGKAARGEKGDSITVTGTDKDGAGNTVVSFSDGSTATIAKGEKGDKGDDGHTPEIGPNGTWVINGEDTGKAARGEKGDSITVTGTDKDGAGNTVVSFSDGSTATIAKGDKGDDGHTPEIGPNGTWVINGEDTGKAARGEKGDSITVTGTDKDGAGNTVVSFSDGSTATIAKGDKGDDGHTPEIGPNGTWVINGEDTGKAARGEKGDSITVTGTDKDGAGNTVVSFSDGSTATIAKGEKGDKGDDGHTPEIGPNGTWVINGEDTGKAARGEKGDSITVTGTDKDGAGNTVVSFSDGSTATIAKGDKGDDGHTPEIGPNGTWVINGEDTGKAARGEKGDSITVTGTDKDGAGNTVVSFSDGSTATIAKGEKGDKGDDGHTPEIGPNGTWVINGEDTGKAARGEKGDSITVTGTDKDGAGNTVVSFSDGSTATIAKGDKGDDGHTPEIGPNGTWVINGEDTGKAARGEKGDSITVTGTDKDGAGNTVVSFSDGSTATIAKGDKGDDGHTPEIGPNGTWVINGEDTGKAARGEKGDSITVTGTDKDGAGNTVVSFSDGSTATIAKGEKGDKGDDGHTPEIGPNGTWVINGEDTGKAARGEKGDSITVTGTDKDGAGNTVVSFSDGSTATIAKGDKGDDGHTPEIGPNGTWVINGEDTGKAARGEKGDSITVTGTDKDGAGNTVVSFSDGSTATIAKGDKGDDGHTPEIGPNGTWVINGEDTGKAARGEKGDSITVTGTDKDGAGNTVVSFSDGSTATIAKGDKGDDGHTPEIGPNGTWVINGEDTGKAARGEKGDSITVTGTDKDGAGNTVVSFSDGSTATIAKGEKGDKGDDGHTPEIGPNGTWVINGEDTGKAARGEKGDSITVTGTDKDGAGNTVVSFSDGSTATIAKGDKGDDGHTPEIGPNGTWVINGEDTGKAARGEKGDSITVTGTDKDGAGNTVVSFSDGSTATIAKGEKGDKGDDGHTPEIGPNGTWVINGEDTGKAARGEKGDSITVTGTDKDGAGNTVVSFSDGSTATIAKGEKGDKGDDGHTPEIGPNGTWVINGEDTGKAARGEKGDSITVTGTDKDGAGNTVVSFSDGSTATIAKGDKGDDGHTPEIGPNGTWVINGEDTGKAARGEKGDSITVTGTDKDGAGNTVVSFSDGSTATIAKGDKGDDGHTPEIGPNGTWVINGEDTGKAARGEKGDSITVTGTDKDGAGNTVVSFSDGSTATIAKGEKGDKGDDGHTPEIGPNGTWVINGEDTGKAARGEKGDSITVTGTDKDGAGNTVVSFSDGSTATIAKGDKGDDGHTPEIGPNGTWVINGEDTGKAARGEKGDSITVTGTDKDGAGNTVVSFSDGSTATIAKGDKGDDGHTPEIGPNGTWVINGEDTGKAARGEKGDSITVTGTDKDGAGNTVVSFSDGSTATIAKGDKGDDGHTPEIGPNGTWVINGEDTGKAARGEKGDSITVTGTDKDGAGNTVVSFSDGSTATIAKGDKGDDGHTPEIGPNGTWVINGEDTGKAARGEKGDSITVTGTDKDGAGNTVVSFSDGSTATIAKGEKGDKGDDGHTPEIGPNGTWVINGEDTGKAARGEKGDSITVTGTDKDGAGNTVVSFSDGSTATIAKGDKGDDGHTPEIGPNGTWVINGEDTGKAARGEKGDSITVTGTDKDGAGNTVVSFSDGSTATIAKGDKGDDGHTPEIGPNGTWVINGEDTGKAARGEKGDSITVTGTDKDGAGNTVVSFSDGSTATIAKGDKGDDGHTPEIGPNGTWVINGEDTGKAARGEKGDSITVTGTDKDGAGNTVVSFSDGSTATIAKGEKGDKGDDGHTPEIGPNGTWVINGEDTGKAARGEKGDSITVTGTDKDGAGNTVVSFSDGSTATIAKGEKGDKGDDGHTPNVSQTPIRDQNGRIVGYTLTFTDPVTGEKIGNSIDVYNGTDGKDGKSVTASVERGEQNGRPGSYIIIRNKDGVELDREFVFDGEDGTTPKVSVQTIERNDGRKTHVVTITNPKTGETQTFTVTDGEKGQPGQAGKDGRDGRDGRDGKNGFTPTISSNGNWFIAGQDTGVKAKGEDGQSITVTKEVKDKQGNTVVYFSDGSTITISKGDRGETGLAGKDGRDGRDGRDGKDGKDLTGNNGNIHVENSNNQSQDQNQTQNQNSNQVVTNNTYNFGDVSLTINQTLTLNGEVVLTKVIVKDKDGLTNETQIDKNTQINQLNVFVNNGQVLVGTFNLTNQNNVKQLLVGNLIINLVINDSPVEPGKPEQPENPGTNEKSNNTPEQPNNSRTPGGLRSAGRGLNKVPSIPGTPEVKPEQPNVPSTPEETPGQPGKTPETPGTSETPNTPTQLSNTPAQPDRSSITGERLPETATDSWMLALASLVSLSSGAVLAVKKKKDDE